MWYFVFAQFLIFQKNNSTETQRKLTLTSGQYYFVKKLKIVEKQLCKLNCSYGKVSHTLKGMWYFTFFFNYYYVFIPKDTDFNKF